MSSPHENVGTKTLFYFVLVCAFHPWLWAWLRKCRVYCVTLGKCLVALCQSLPLSQFALNVRRERLRKGPWRT